MKNEKEIDKLIKESLNAEEAEFYQDLDQQGVFKMWFDLYKGKMGKWAILITFIQLVLPRWHFGWAISSLTLKAQSRCCGTVVACSSRSCLFR